MYNKIITGYANTGVCGEETWFTPKVSMRGKDNLTGGEYHAPEAVQD